MMNLRILLVEDNEGDILLTKEALEEVIVNPIYVLKDGEQAIEFLSKISRSVKAPKPDLILLDINLPKKNGYEVLRYIKTSDKLKDIPVIILTTSSDQKDIDRAYAEKANFYITKPVEPETFLKVIAKIKEFWRSVIS